FSRTGLNSCTRKTLLLPAFAATLLAGPNRRVQTMPSSSAKTGHPGRSHCGIRNSWQSVLIFRSPALSLGWYWSPDRQFRSIKGPDRRPQSKQPISLLYTESDISGFLGFSSSSREIDNVVPGTPVIPGRLARTAYFCTVPGGAKRTQSNDRRTS